jgi:DNA-directed RNA polymerase subunit F
MAIKEETPITLAEVVELAGDSESGKKVKDFIKRFNKMPVKKAKEMKTELTDLDLIKLKDMHIVKIVDFLPENAIELNKVVVDVSLDQEEINKILDVVKKYK